MSSLRTQLRQARQVHVAQRYPGNLSEEILAPVVSITRHLWIGAAAAGGLAAVLLMIVWLGRNPGSEEIASVSAPSQASAASTEPAIWLAFTIDRPAETAGEVHFAPSGADASVPSYSSISVPVVWGFPTPASIQEELSNAQPEQEPL
jgi:hypothetical protein